MSVKELMTLIFPVYLSPSLTIAFNSLANFAKWGSWGSSSQWYFNASMSKVSTRSSVF